MDYNTSPPDPHKSPNIKLLEVCIACFVEKKFWSMQPAWVQVLERKQAASQNLMGVRGRCVVSQLIDLSDVTCAQNQNTGVVLIDKLRWEF